MTVPEPAQLRDRLVAALQAAAGPCDGTNCRETDAECEAAHPVRRPEPWRYVVRIEGSPEGIADTVLGIVQPELDAKQSEISRLIGFIERGFDTHMQFGVIGEDGVTTMQPCADWCYACKLDLAREAASQRAAQLEEARDLFTSAGILRAHGDDWPDIIPALQEVIDQRDQARAQLAAAGLIPVEQPPGATVLPCSSVLFRTFDGAGTHLSHTWAPQPGVTPVWCPGVAPVPEPTP